MILFYLYLTLAGPITRVSYACMIGVLQHIIGFLSCCFTTLGLIGKHGPLVPAKHGSRIFFQFPVRDTAGTARSFEPFVPEPPGGAAVSGVVDHKNTVAVGGNSGLVAHLFNGPDTVQHSLAGWPQFDLVNQPEQLHPFPVITLLRGFRLFAHCNKSNEKFPITNKEYSMSK